MKSFFRSLTVKVVVFLLTATVFLITAVSGTLTVTLEAFDFYNYSKDDLKTELMSRKIAEECYTSFRGAYYHHAVANDPNFRYTVYEREGTKIAGTDVENTKYTVTYYYYEWKEEGYNSLGEYYSYYDSTFTKDGEFRGMHPMYSVTGGYDAYNPVTTGDLYLTLRAVDLLHGMRIVFPLTTAAGLLVTILGIVYLCVVAGKTANQEEAVLRGINKLPFDLFLALVAGAEFGLVALGWMVLESERLSLWLLCLPLLGWIALALLLAVTFSLAARIKVGGILKTTILGRLCFLLFRGLRKGGKALLELIRKIPTVPTVATIAGFFALVNVLLGILTQEPLAVLLLTTESLLGFLLAIAFALGFSTVEKHAKSIADGDLNRKTDTKYLIGPLKNHAEDLNRIGDGLNTAVNERMKSERMKTELITNVSHDIKTPLTSIINYVDLLSKETEMNENTAEYLLVLQRQSARLQKLVEDIVEASKASSGVLRLEPTPCNLGVLLEQTVGEYAEKTQEKQLTVLLSLPKKEVSVMADGRRLWRVFANLMNNICKYALPSTRVYLNVTEEKESAVITFRNISKEPLNIPPEELTERFVRGDASRHSEGSGLGLAIARSFVELQGGRFDISIDADLFKVTIAFPLISQREEPEYAENR